MGEGQVRLYISVPNYAIIGIGLITLAGLVSAQTDPGPRGGSAGAGGAIGGLTTNQGSFFTSGLASFSDVEAVSNGLGPRFNLSSCGGCHAQPAVGGSSPSVNPQVTVAPSSQVLPLVALNIIKSNGPVREVRFKSDGGVHDLFTIVGRTDNPSGCNISQPNFAAHVAANDVIFRTPTPVFGGGLIEAIPEATIRTLELLPKPFGISGHANRNGNDGTITRFGWKAQNKSLLIFAGEAYNVEQGVSNELFPDERGEGGVPDPDVCKPAGSSNDHTNFDSTTATGTLSDTVNFANFMRFLAPPTPVSSYGSVSDASVDNGAFLFLTTGCAFCHVPALQTGIHSVAALSNQTAKLFSDLLVHKMGKLGDGISQGNAGPTEFRTAPLWGLGQRLFFLHDGRTNNLLSAIEAHADGGTDPASEADTVIQIFNSLSTSQKQDILNFLRSL